MDQQQPAPQSDNRVPQVEAPAQSVKQQVVEKVNGAKNVLVTVGAQPSVDELAAALGLTFLLGKLQKHVTAVFSGETPPAIEFLDPEKTFERSVDSLRDFIIALDKEKADKLRYKVEEDVVKVFITPYKTVISEKDLQFSQGDFNVDVILALGITKREDLDKAIVAHGRILHDAEVITINANGKKSNIGSIDWADDAASSISEMLVSVSEVFGNGLLDEQISTALLTGIVAETNRFSNEKTSPKVMTMAAQLMAAGANQQLIATNLRQEGMISESVRTKKPVEGDDNGEMVLDHGKNQPVAMPSKQQASENKSAQPKQGPKDSQKSEQKPKPSIVNEQKSSSSEEPQNTEVTSPQTTQEPTGLATDQSAQNATPSLPEPQVERELIPAPPADSQPEISQDEEKISAQKPSFGGTLNATSAQAEQDKADQLERERQENNQTLEHGTPTGDSTASDDAIEAARKALEEVTEAQPFNPANNPTQSVGAQALPPVREESQVELPPLPSVSPPAIPDASAGEVQAQNVVQQNSSAAAQAPPEPSPVEAFMQPHQETPQAPNSLNMPLGAPDASVAPSMPPLPPLPTMPSDGGVPSMPPMPPLPGQASDPAAGFQPQVNPAFMQNVPQSQNSWTQAGEDMAAKQADKEASRQAKLDQMGAQYDAAVDKNRELQGKPPVNNDHSTFPLPPSS